MDGRRSGAGWLAVGLLLLLSAGCLGADVAINEVAWSGTAASTYDEWIELYNTTDEAIDLTGWTLTFGERVIHLGAVEGSTSEVRRSTIEPGGYYLLERQDDGTVSDVEADLLYKGSLSNDGATLELRDAAGEIVDTVDASEAGWPAGTAGDAEPPHASMERVDPTGEAAAWASNDGRTRNGADANGDPLNGTPGRENSARIVARAAPRVELVAPSEAEAVLSGVVVVEWSATDPDGPAEGLAISIELSLDGGETWAVLVDNLANGGSYAWDTALHPDGDRVRLRVTAEDADGYRGTAESPVLTIRNGTG
jgi:hypothetical protein